MGKTVIDVIHMFVYTCRCWLVRVRIRWIL